ncbi:hypothetical protein GTO89_10200 [Heliobacterium gestii]|uniref:HAMP domain-containing protein n=1 Tax=Heliomicrobium gestii TaxID=2699 RepID=A0A845L9T1_HELGE|nr:hypothetical protein [Heliomicrobium gestii]MBM7868214.1 HAMP domain-containing protein [Heliomicrobium gestii]MZP43412.1 hypothetical protein [Heliomicrobium gestii]
MQQKLALQIGIVLFVNLAVVFALTQLTYRPIVRLSKLSKALADGNLDILRDASLHTHDEIGDLQAAIKNNVSIIDMKKLIENVN